MPHQLLPRASLRAQPLTNHPLTCLGQQKAEMMANGNDMRELLLSRMDAVAQFCRRLITRALYRSLVGFLDLIVLQCCVFSAQTSKSQPVWTSVALDVYFGSSTRSALWQRQLENRNFSAQEYYTKYTLAMAAPTRKSQLFSTSVARLATVQYTCSTQSTVWQLPA